MFELNAQDLSQFPAITFPLMGSSSHRYMNISPLHYQQLDVVTFYQMRLEKYLVEVIKN